MAGITYLYGLWNINMLGDSTIAPSLMEAHLDVQACLSTLEALAGESSTSSSGYQFEEAYTTGFFPSHSQRAFGETKPMDFRNAQYGHFDPTFRRTGV
jgi:hypothetical protein